MTELEKIDALRHRVGMGYSEAKLALDAAGGDLIQALITKEKELLSVREKFRDSGKQTWEQFKAKAVLASNARIKLKRGEKVLFTIPAPLGAIGLVGALASTPIAMIGLAGTAVALANKCSLQIDEDGRKTGFDNSKPSDI